MSELENNNSALAVAVEPEGEMEPVIDQATLEEMAKAGVLFGRSKSKTNPKMKTYIEVTRSGVEVFSPSQVLEAVEKAANFLTGVAQKGGLILFLGTQPSAGDLVKSIAERFGLPYVVERWLGGTLTNYNTISKRLQYYMNLKADQASGKLEKYTKKERLQFDKEIQRLSHLFGGLEKLNKVADVLVVVDAKEHETAVREAKRLSIPIVALINSNNDPDGIEYVIPCNSSAKPSIEWIAKKLADGIQKGIEERQTLQAVINGK